MVNRGEEKVRIHMNVVPRSTVCSLCSQCYAAQHSYENDISYLGCFYLCMRDVGLFFL